MKQIGGFFTYEPLPETENHYLENLCPPGGSLRFFMSGRCANYYALQDICLTDTKKAAYVPVYTCETVLAPFLKAGYELLFYDVSKDLTHQRRQSLRLLRLLQLRQGIYTEML